MKLSLLKLLEVGASRSYYATDAQKNYIRILSREAFAKGYKLPFRIEPHQMDRLTFEEAKMWLNDVVAAKNAGWPQKEPEPEDPNTHVNIIRPDGTRGTVLRRIWETSQERLLAKGYKLAE